MKYEITAIMALLLLVGCSPLPELDNGKCLKWIDAPVTQSTDVFGSRYTTTYTEQKCVRWEYPLGDGPKSVGIRK